MHQTILILGGDERQAHLAALLRGRGLLVLRPALPCEDAVLAETVCRCRGVLLPYPVSRDGVFVSGAPDRAFRLDAVLTALTNGQWVVGGGFSPAQCAALDRAGVRWLDCTHSEMFLSAYAALTAQGALRLLLCSTDDDLCAAQYLITGFGRVARAVAKLLCAIGCSVTVAARDPQQRTQAALLGCKAIDVAAWTHPPFPSSSTPCRTGCFLQTPHSGFARTHAIWSWRRRRSVRTKTMLPAHI